MTSYPQFYAGTGASTGQRPTTPVRPTTQNEDTVARATERLEARVNADQKQLFTRAASLSGVSLTSFVVQAVAERAQKVVHEHDVMRLSAEDSQAFANALLENREPSDRLARAARRYRAKTGV